MKPVLILKTGSTLASIAKTRGDFEEWIIDGMQIAPEDSLTVSVFEGEALPAVDSVSAVVVTGSPAMVTERSDWIRESERFLLEVVNRQVPVLGICFGHQLLAQALGGRVDWHPQGREIGTTSVQLSSKAGKDALFRDLPGRFPVHVTHMQSVMEIPPGTTILAGNAFDPHHGLLFSKNAWGIQFHPEFDAAITRGYIQERYEQVKGEGLDPDVLLTEVAEAPEANSLLRSFAALVRRWEGGQEA